MSSPKAFMPKGKCILYAITPKFAPKAQFVSERWFAALEREEVDRYFLSEGSQTYGTEQQLGHKWFWRVAERLNERNPSSEICRDILGCMDCQGLNEVLFTFIVETRKENGESILCVHFYQLLSTLHRYVLLLHPDEDLPQFCSSKNTFRRLLIKALASLYMSRVIFTLLGCL